MYLDFRKLLGQDLGTCSVEELHDIHNQLENSLKTIRARKVLRLDSLCNWNLTRINNNNNKKNKIRTTMLFFEFQAELYKEDIKKSKAKVSPCMISKKWHSLIFVILRIYMCFVTFFCEYIQEKFLFQENTRLRKQVNLSIPK